MPMASPAIGLGHSPMRSPNVPRIGTPGEERSQPMPSPVPSAGGLTEQALLGLPVGHVMDPEPIGDRPAISRGELRARHVQLDELRDQMLSKEGGDVSYSLAKAVRKADDERRVRVLTHDPSTALADEWKTRMVRDELTQGTVDGRLPPSLARRKRHWSAGRSSGRLSRKSLGGRSYVSIYEGFGGQWLGEDSSEEQLSTPSDEEPGEEEPLLSDFEEEERDDGNDNVATFLTLVKACCGPAHLYLAKAFAHAGVVSGVIGLTVCCFLSIYCIVLLVRAQNRSRAIRHGQYCSFADVGKCAFRHWRHGKPVYWMVEACLVSSQLGLVTMYFIFIGQTIQNFIGYFTNCAGWVTAFFSITSLIFMQAGLQMPMSLLRHLRQIAFFAILADILILSGMSFVMIDNVETIVRGPVSQPTMFRADTFALFLGTSILTFEGIGLMLPIHDAMNTPKDFTPLMLGAFSLCLLLFIGFGLLGYMAQGGDAVNVNILIAMPDDAYLSQAAKVLYSLAVVLTFPLQAFPAYRIVEIGLNMPSGKHDLKAKWKKNFLRLSTVLVLAMVAYAAGAHLDNFVAILGGLTMCPLAFVFPAIFHYKLCAQTKFQRIVDGLLFMFGVAAVVFITVMAVYDWVFGSSEPLPGCKE